MEQDVLIHAIFDSFLDSWTIRRGVEKGARLIISSSNVGMESARTYRSTTTRKLSLSQSIVSYRFSDEALGNQSLLGRSDDDEKLETGEGTKTTADNQAAEDAMARLKSSSSPISARMRQLAQGSEDKGIEQVRQKCVLYLWELFFGKDRASKLAEEFDLQEAYMDTQPRELQMMEVTASEEVYFKEEENMSFSTAGTVVTADGRQISFNMNVGMSRSFEQYYKQQSTDVIAMCDPLVINLDSDVVGLSDQKFFFDLDCDGTEEEISTLEKGNAFLALDHNKDGKINDGSELFGAKTGDGFADLARYDEDGNGWIDEADSVFDKLKIWVKDEKGEDRLYTLKEKDLGAIYLGSQAADYTLRSSQTGEINGQIRRNGLFLYESGMAGTIAHVDMAKGISESA